MNIGGTMKTHYVALLFLAGLLVLAATPAATAAPAPQGARYYAENSTLVFGNGTSMVFPVVTPPVKNTTKTVTKYPLPHWMPKPFDGTYETCRMGVIGKNSRGEKVCFRRRGR
jgi:hypothetical protein